MELIKDNTEVERLREAFMEIIECTGTSTLANKIAREAIQSNGDEYKVEYSINLISDFIEHLKSEADIQIPEKHLLSFFNA